MRLRKKILFLFIIFLFFLVLCEATLRLFKLVYLKVENESIYPSALGDYKPSQQLNSDYILPHSVKINSLGLRGEEIRIDKEEGVYRILILGDSYTFGCRVDNDKSFPFQLEQLFNKDNQRVEVVNCGHASYSTREEYEYLTERGVILGPDMVILAWFPNDISELSREYSWRSLLKEHYKFEPFKSYLRSLALYNYLRIYTSYAYIKFRFGPYVPKENINISDSDFSESELDLWEKCFDYILKIDNFCKERKIKFLVAALVEPAQFNNASPDRFAIQKKIKNFCSVNGIDCLDLSKRFSDFSSKNDFKKLYLFPKDPHFSPLGNKIVAEEIFEYLRKKEGRSLGTPRITQ